MARPASRNLDSFACSLIANRYGIPASKLGQALTSNPDVHAFGVMVGSLGNQAAKLTRELPAGQAFVCLDTAQLPKIMKQIFTSTLLK